MGETAPAPGTTTRALPRALLWAGLIVFGPVLLVLVFIAIFGWNWLRGPIERAVLQKTGRVLAIQGDLGLHFGWPRPRLRAATVTFANPPWAAQTQMVSAEAVEVTVDLLQLMRFNIAFPEVRLEHPVIYLEQGTEGRKNWLLDKMQQDENARIHIERLTVDQGVVGYDDAALKTSVRAQVSSLLEQADSRAGGVTFSGGGLYKGLPMVLKGSGGPVLALRDESTPYPINVDAAIGRTVVQAQGTVTSLLKFSAVDMQLALRGDSLEQLFPLLGIALPVTRAYSTRGHLVHHDKLWRFDKFTGQIGASDVAGDLQINTAGERPQLKGELVSKLLDIDDLGPVIGARPGAMEQARAKVPAAVTAVTPRSDRVLPDLPFKTDRWLSLDAELGLTARTIRRAAALPLEDLKLHLSLRDAVLKLDPITFGLAGGELGGKITLDGRGSTIQADAQLRARKIMLARMFPTVPLNQVSVGQINGSFDLHGSGHSVGQMLASADGKVGLVVAGGEVSRLMMEKAGLHLWEILQLSLSGDQRIKLRCAVADFDVHNGKMLVQALVFDTAVTTITGTGSIDLAQERLDLLLRQNTKNTSPLALRSPIHVSGTLARPEVGVDKLQVAARGLGALALGVVNPFLALIPLIDAGPGKDSDCGELVREARALPHPPQRAASARP